MNIDKIHDIGGIGFDEIRMPPKLKDHKYLLRY